MTQALSPPAPRMDGTVRAKLQCGFASFCIATAGHGKHDYQEALSFGFGERPLHHALKTAVNRVFRVFGDGAGRLVPSTFAEKVGPYEQSNDPGKHRSSSGTHPLSARRHLPRASLLI